MGIGIQTVDASDETAVDPCDHLRCGINLWAVPKSDLAAAAAAKAVALPAGGLCDTDRSFETQRVPPVIARLQPRHKCQQKQQRLHMAKSKFYEDVSGTSIMPATRSKMLDGLRFSMASLEANHSPAI